MITYFKAKRMSKEKVPCKCLLIITPDSVVKAERKYYPHKHSWKNANMNKKI